MTSFFRPERKVAGLELAPNPCPKCGGRMFKRPCPCFLARKGWSECARCADPKCANVVGLKRKSKLSRRKKR